jgi:type VI protein secretion system component VasK
MSSNSALLATDLAPWTEYGLAGLVIAALFGLVIFLLKGHKEERREWSKDAKERELCRDSQGDEFIKVQAKMTEAIKELTVSQRESLKLHREMHEDHIRRKAIRDADLSKG